MPRRLQEERSWPTDARRAARASLFKLPSFKFPRGNRISRQIEIRRVFKNGRRLTRGGVCLFLLPTQGPSRVATSIRKKQYKRAVDRNRIKRWTREYFRKSKTLFCGQFDMIVQIKNTEDCGSFQIFTGQIETILRNAEVL